MTFGDFWPIYFQKKELMVKRTTLAAYDLAWHGNLEQYFHNVEMDDVKPSDIQTFVDNRLRERCCSVKTIRDQIIVLKNMLKIYALSYDLPAREYPLVWPSQNKNLDSKPREKFTDQELTRLMEYCKNSPDHLTKLIALVAMTGMRIGEASGLQFGDFDFEKKMIHVQRTVSRVYFSSKGESEILIGPPKSVHSNRFIPVPDWLCRYYKNYQKLFKLPDDAFITPNTSKSALEPRTMRPLYYKVCEKAGVRRLPFHCLRHTYASRLILSKADIRTVAELLGHADVAVTLNIYSHSDNGRKSAIAKKIFL